MNVSGYKTALSPKVRKSDTMQHHYILEPYSGIKTRYTCPQCAAKKQFARYIDTETKTTLADNVGRCNRELNCGYHYTPKQYFEAQRLQNPTQYKPPTIQQSKPAQAPTPPPPPLTPLPAAMLTATCKAYQQNNFAQYLFGVIGTEAAQDLLSRYHVGTSKHWPGATIFWQIDFSGNLRAGKVMLYNATGHRVKEPFPHITWIHKLTTIPGYQLSQCFFGEHLLKQNPTKPAAIVESEKTALIGAAWQSDFIWLAAGNLNNLTRERCQHLKGRTVFLYPDAGAFAKWQSKAAQLADLATFVVSDMIERAATPAQLAAGFDLADFLSTTKPKQPEPVPVPQLPPQIKPLLKYFDVEYIRHVPQ